MDRERDEPTQSTPVAVRLCPCGMVLDADRDGPVFCERCRRESAAGRQP
jgi:hypothetical protein